MPVSKNNKKKRSHKQWKRLSNIVKATEAYRNSPKRKKKE